MLAACFFPTALFPQSWVHVLTVGFWLRKILFSPAALVSEPKWLKQGSEFITSGQCNYLGSGHVTEINMTQSAQSLTLVHDKVRRCLFIERSGLLDFLSLLLFWFTIGSLEHYKRAIVLQEGEVMNRLLKSHLCREPHQSGCLYYLKWSQLIHSSDALTWGFVCDWSLYVPDVFYIFQQGAPVNWVQPLRRVDFSSRPLPSTLQDKLEPCSIWPGHKIESNLLVHCFINSNSL